MKIKYLMRYWGGVKCFNPTDLSFVLPISYLFYIRQAYVSSRRVHSLFYNLANI